MQKRGFQGEIILDVGHNPHAIERVLQRYLLEIDDGLDNLILVFGCKLQKDAMDILTILDQKGVGNVAFVTSKKHKELMTDPKSLLEKSKSLKHVRPVVIDGEGDIGATLHDLINKHPTGKHLVISGSFNLMFEARKYFGYQDSLDPELETII